MNKLYAGSRRLALGLALTAAALPAAAQIPANIDFGAGNFSNWTVWTGIATENPIPTDPVYMASPVSGAPISGAAPGPGSAVKSRHAITTGTALDFYGGFPSVCPAGSGSSARIGNDVNGAEADRIQYYIHVPAGTTSFNVQYQYAAVLEDPGHDLNMQPSFQVIAYDSATGAVIPGANNMYVAKYLVPGFFPYIDPVTSLADSSKLWLPWTACTANLSGMGGRTVILECTALDCSPSGHWGYGYFDVTSVQDSLAASLLRYNSSGDSAVLQGPAGYRRYRYYDQNFTNEIGGVNDTVQTQTLQTPWAAQYYNLVITPYDRNGLADTLRTPILRGRNVGVAAMNLKAARLYPNPASEKLRLEFATPFSGSIELRNATGALVWNGRFSSSSQTVIPVESVPAGIYTLQLQDASGATEVRQVSIR